jgi:anti-sigma factor RsiW
MVCKSWKAKLDTYLDGELAVEEMRGFNAHLHTCPSCAKDALVRVQMKRGIQAAGKRFTPMAEFRNQVQKSIAARPWRSSMRFGWVIATTTLTILLVIGMAITHGGRDRTRREQIYSELADLHVATLASSAQMDVVSSDRYPVKSWFEGKVPFTLNLPDLQNSEFSLLGGRITYLDQVSGAHLIYQLRNQDISVFIFLEEAVRGKWNEEYPVVKELSFHMETWSQGGLRYCIIGDASAGDIDDLAELLKRASSS